jgi:hypothetical protein
MEALRQRFPRAPAWGKLVHKKGDVSKSATPTTDAGSGIGEDEHGIVQQVGPRSAHERQPSTRVQGPEWE